MATHIEFGKNAENKAAAFLEQAGYKILERNWYYLKAEIDIIAEKGNELIIVEVKARSSNEVMQPEEAVTLTKKKLLLLAANQYVIDKDLDIEVRFDIISILKKGDNWKINHIEDAFNAVL